MGKAEMWYVLDAKPGAVIIHGFTEGYGKEKILKAVSEGKHVVTGAFCKFQQNKDQVYNLKRVFLCQTDRGRGIPLGLTADGSFSAFMFIEGEAEIVSDLEKLHARALETVFIPAYMGSYEITGVFSALQVLVPESLADEYKSSVEKGFSNKI